MSEDTPVWVDNGGESHNTAIIGVKPILNHEGMAYTVILETEHCEL